MRDRAKRARANLPTPASTQQQRRRERCEPAHLRVQDDREELGEAGAPNRESSSPARELRRKRGALRRTNAQARIAARQRDDEVGLAAQVLLGSK